MVVTLLLKRAPMIKIHPQLFLPALFGSTYQRRILNLFGASIIAYWPLWEPSGATANDISGNARNGSYTGATLGQTGIGDGHTAPLFDASGDFCNVFSASLQAAFNGAEGALMCWARVFDAGVWTDGTLRHFLNFGVDSSNNYAALVRSTVNNRIAFNRAGGGTTRQIAFNGVTTLNWFHFAGAWSESGGEVNAYLNGVAGAPLAPTAWTGLVNAARCVIGGRETTPAALWNGWLAHAVLLNRPATPTEIAIAAKV